MSEHDTPELLNIDQVRELLPKPRTKKPISDYWLKRHFIPEHQKKIGRETYWPKKRVLEAMGGNS